MNKRLCIFDMDGTLVDSMGCWQKMQRDYLTAMGIARDRMEEAIEFAKPLPLLESAKWFIEKCGISGTPESVMDEMAAIMERCYRENVTAKAGAKDYLAALKRMGCRCCIASATEKYMVESCLTRLGLRDSFDFLLSCAEAGAGKNRPDVFLEAARRLGADVKETAVFEDSLQAGKTAKRAGFCLVAVYDENSAGTWAELSALADETVTDWRAAAELL